MNLDNFDNDETTEDDKELLYLNRAPRCGFCLDKGLIFAYSIKRPNDGMYAFKCDCKGGPPWLLDRKFPYWGSKSGFVNSKFELPPHPLNIYAELDKSKGKSDLFKSWVARWGRNRFVGYWRMWKAQQSICSDATNTPTNEQREPEEALPQKVKPNVLTS